MRKNRSVRFIVISSLLHLFLLLLFLFGYGGKKGSIGADGLVRVILTSDSPAEGERGGGLVTDQASKAEAVADNNLGLSKQLPPEKDAGVSAGGEPAADSDILISGNGSRAAGTGIIIYHKPSYPIISRIRGEEGRVRLSAGIKGDGLVKTVRIEKSSGYERLDRAAVKALYEFRFIPSLLAAGGMLEEKKVSFLFALEE